MDISNPQQALKNFQEVQPPSFNWGEFRLRLRRRLVAAKSDEDTLKIFFEVMGGDF